MHFIYFPLLPLRTLTAGHSDRRSPRDQPGAQPVVEPAPGQHPEPVHSAAADGIEGKVKLQQSRLRVAGELAGSARRHRQLSPINSAAVAAAAALVNPPAAAVEGRSGVRQREGYSVEVNRIFLLDSFSE